LPAIALDTSAMIAWPSARRGRPDADMTNNVIASHSRSENGVASLAYGEAIQSAVATDAAPGFALRASPGTARLLRRFAPRNDVAAFIVDGDKVAAAPSIARKPEM
jgi:hypothetical protein